MACITLGLTVPSLITLHLFLHAIRCSLYDPIWITFTTNVGGIFEIPKTTIFNLKKVQNQRAFGFGFLKVLEIKEPFGFSSSKVFKIKEPVGLGVQQFSDLLGS